MSQHPEFRVSALCRVLQVSRSGYYESLKRPPSPRRIENDRLRPLVQVAFVKGRKNYGTRQIKGELAKQTIYLSRRRIGRLMQENGLYVQTRRKFKATTDSKHHKPIAPDLLERHFTADAPNTVYVGDITYIPTREGWLYLAVVIDLFSRAVVGWSMGSRITAGLVREALRMAIGTRTPGRGLIFHSDRGSQYASECYRKLLGHHGFRASMSRKGNCWDNAVAESFFHTLKIELVHHCDYATRGAAKASIFEYIEVFYNRQRSHSTIGYQAPLVFEAMKNNSETLCPENC